MDTPALAFAILTATLAFAAIHAWRLGNDRRDVALLGTFGGLSGAGAAAVAIL